MIVETRCATFCSSVETRHATFCSIDAACHVSTKCFFRMTQSDDSKKSVLLQAEIVYSITDWEYQSKNKMKQKKY
jgi:hypothetical protein